ncbi:MAG TPA: hypothetical protein VGI32_03185 [Steroidobacteraceae bacterium]
MSEVNVLWGSAWLKLQKNLARGFQPRESIAGLICDPHATDTTLTAGSWLVRARRGIGQEASLSR